MREEIIRAIYEAKREQIILARISPATKDSVSAAYAYAYTCRMCPVQELDTSKNDPFAGFYDIEADVVNNVLAYLDTQWLSGIDAVPSFYDLEAHFGGKGSRSDLICIIRYAKIHQMFDDAFYKKLVSNAPLEANTLHQFKLTDQDFYIP